MKHLKYLLAAVAVLFLAAILFASCRKGGKMSSITIVPASATIATGTTQQFQSYANFTDGSMILWTPASVWVSSDPTVTVGNVLGTFGLASSIATAGTVTITATDVANNLSSTATLSIIDPSSLVVTPANPFMAIGTSHQFVASVILDLGSGETLTQAITSLATWTTTDPTIATITSPGGALTTSQTYTFATDIQSTYTFTTMVSSVPTQTSVTGTTTLTVTATPVESISVGFVSLPTPTVTLGSAPQQAEAIGLYSSGTVTYDYTNSVTWTSSNANIAQVTQSGLVSTSTQTGQTTITASDPITGKTGSILFEVD